MRRRQSYRRFMPSGGRRMLATGIALTSLVAVALTATVAAAPRATVPIWRGTVDLAVSASHPADPEYSFDGPDSFTYSARLQRASLAEGDGRARLARNADLDVQGRCERGHQKRVHRERFRLLPGRHLDLPHRRRRRPDPPRSVVPPGAGPGSSTLGGRHARLELRLLRRFRVGLRKPHRLALTAQLAAEHEVVLAGDQAAGALGHRRLGTGGRGNRADVLARR
jgi:hypothetical protein